MSWLRFQMDLISEPKDESEVSEDSAPSISESFEPSEFPESFEPSVPLVKGQLTVMDGDTTTMSFVATSGTQSFQFLNAQSLIGRGPIPACKKIGIDAYTVRTSPFDLINPGIEENFYYIEPDTIDIDGVIRGEFVIHFDTDSPGAAGSIVLRKKNEWQQFQNFMSDYLGKGFPAINLVVEYTMQGKTINHPLLPATGESVFTIENPKAGESKKLNEEIAFSGTAKPQVSMIIATVGPEKTNGLEDSKQLFIIGEVNPTDRKWNFNQTLVNVGIRHFKFRALDEVGNLLQTVEFDLVFV